MSAIDEIDPPEGEVAEQERQVSRKKATELLAADSLAVQMLFKGRPDIEIAKKIGVKQSAIRAIRMNMAKSVPMADLMGAESSRVMSHLATRDLGDEKYLALVTAMGVMIEKERLLRNESTANLAVIGSGTIESLNLALFGPAYPGSGRGTARDPDDDAKPAENAPDEPQELPGEVPEDQEDEH